MRYNYILSAALDAGVALSMVLIFFVLQYPKGGFTINWWGNTGKNCVLTSKSRELKHGIQFG
jgi:hypothetical protein